MKSALRLLVFSRGATVETWLIRAGLRVKQFLKFFELLAFFDNGINFIAP